MIASAQFTIISPVSYTHLAKLANILEYGKHGQPAKPFLKPVKTASRQECIDAMTKALNEEVEKL